METIKEWPQPKSFHDIQVFLSFCNFYRRFIEGYAKIARPLHELLKRSVKGRKPGSVDLSGLELAAFERLKQAFQEAPLLRHFDPKLPIRVETDASRFAMAAILSQRDVEGRWHPVAFWSHKFDGAELNYSTSDQEIVTTYRLP